MEPQEIMQQLFDSKVFSILKFFMKNENGKYYLREIARHSNVSAASTYRILGKLTDMDILELEEIKTAKLYNLKQNKTTDFLKTLVEVDVLDNFIDQVKKLDGVEEIILLGNKTKTKANVLILGINVNAADLKMISGTLKEKYDYTVNHMTLIKEQYEQMSSMGLYPGTKNTLYKKP